MKDEYKGFLIVMIMWGTTSGVLYGSMLFLYSPMFGVEYDKLLLGIICMAIAAIISAIMCHMYGYSIFIPAYLEEKNDK